MIITNMTLGQVELKTHTMFYHCIKQWIALA